MAEQDRPGHQAAFGLRLRAGQPDHASPARRTRRRSRRAATRRPQVRHHSRIPLLNRTDDKERTMPGLPIAAFRAVGQDDAIPDGFVVPFYLNDRKLRISVARVGDHLYAFGVLCSTCADHRHRRAGIAAIHPYHDCSFPSAFLLRPACLSLGRRPAGTGSAGERGTGARCRARRSSSVVPPQMPETCPRSSAQRRHGVVTGQRWQTRLAASISVSDAPEVLTGKNRSGSRPLQAAWSRQSVRSAPVERHGFVSVISPPPR